MLYPTELPDCAELLEKVLDFQERLLEFGCREPEVTPAQIQEVVGEEAYTWLNSSTDRRKLLGSVYSFAKLCQHEKNAILADFRHDRNFVDHLDDAEFQFQLSGVGTVNGRKTIKTWLIRFYDEFSKATGLSGSILGDDQSISKEHWKIDFRNKNNRRLTCAVCDGSMNHDVTTDHFLPKSHYPALSVHPYNLLPVCDKCNNDKGKKDPLADHNLTMIFMPYRDDVQSSARLELSNNDQGGEKLDLVPNTPDPVIDSQLQSLSDLFNIPSQWQNNIHEISEIAWRQLRSYVETLSDEGIALRRVDMPYKLDKLCDRMESDWGTAHYYYPATEWLRWAKCEKFEKLCDELMITS